MRHLSDDLIQQYLDAPELTDRTIFDNHFKVCFECQAKLEHYQELYRHLAVEYETVPDASLNVNILAAVDKIESRKKSRLQVQIAGALSGIILLALSLNYFGLFSWQGLLSAVKSTSANIFSPIYETAGLLVEKLNGNLELLAFAGLVLLLFQLLDHNLMKHKVNRT